MVRSFLTVVVLNLAISNLMIAKIDFEGNMLYLAMNGMERMVPVIDEELAKAKEQATLLLNNWNEHTKFGSYFGSFQWPNLFKLIKNTEDNLRNALGDGTAKDIQNATHAAKKLISLMPTLREFKDKSGNFERDNPLYDEDIRDIVDSNKLLREWAFRAGLELPGRFVEYEKSIDNFLRKFLADPAEIDLEVKAAEAKIFLLLRERWKKEQEGIRKEALEIKVRSLLEAWSQKGFELYLFGFSPLFVADQWPNLFKLIKKMNNDLESVLGDNKKDRELAIRAAKKLVELIGVLRGFQLKVQNLMNRNQFYDSLMKAVYEDTSRFATVAREVEVDALHRYEKSIDDSLVPFINDLEKIDQNEVNAAEKKAFEPLDKEWQGARAKISAAIDADTADHKKVISMKMDIIKALYSPWDDPVVSKGYVSGMDKVVRGITELNEKIQREIKSPTFDVSTAMRKYKDEIAIAIRALYNRYSFGSGSADSTIKTVHANIDKILENLKKP